MTFVLDPRLAADTLALGSLSLCAVRLMDDARYPWLILVPRRPEVREIYELSRPDRALLIEESCAIASAIAGACAPTKINVAALGNVVAQLHVHHVARFVGDDAWPGPVWGAHPRRPYADRAAEVARWRAVLTALDGFVPCATGDL